MIEWKNYDKDNPPESGKPFITIGTTGIVIHGYYEVGKFADWLDNMEDPIRNVTHYAEINLPLN